MFGLLMHQLPSSKWWGLQVLSHSLQSENFSQMHQMSFHKFVNADNRIIKVVWNFVHQRSQEPLVFLRRFWFTSRACRFQRSCLLAFVGEPNYTETSVKTTDSLSKPDLWVWRIDLQYDGCCQSVIWMLWHLGFSWPSFPQLRDLSTVQARQTVSQDSPSIKQATNFF